MSDVVIKILFALVMLTAIFYGCLFVWEFLVRFVWKEPSLSILFEEGEER